MPEMEGYYGHDKAGGEKAHAYGPPAGGRSYAGKRAYGNAGGESAENPVKGGEGDAKVTKSSAAPEASMSPGKAKSYKNPGMKSDEDADSGSHGNPRGY